MPIWTRPISTADLAAHSANTAVSHLGIEFLEVGDDFLRALVDMQYSRNDIDLKRATFRVRGDVVDIFPAENSETALRLSLFDDEVESLSPFDPLTGQILSKVSRFTVYPSSHYVTPRETTLRAIEAIEAAG